MMRKHTYIIEIARPRTSGVWGPCLFGLLAFARCPPRANARRRTMADRVVTDAECERAYQEYDLSELVDQAKEAPTPGPEFCRTWPYDPRASF
eukprot:6884998-Pyramimonas_sp.AAC.1